MLLKSLETMIYSGSFDCFEKMKKFMIDNLKEAIEISTNIDEKGNYIFTPNCIINEETTQEKEKFLDNQFVLIGFNVSKEKNNKILEIRNSYSAQKLGSISVIAHEVKGNVYTIFITMLKEKVWFFWLFWKNEEIYDW